MHTGIQTDLSFSLVGHKYCQTDTVPQSDAGVQCEDMPCLDCFMPVGKSTPEHDTQESFE